ncbi:sensor domain-containing phosphodiesterase [Hippea sp. KM1]|uniref:sensor domain-containing phosphodiesterase n=1 Tax=Hippea sp. KM1 TaxID=944481 RepID=UPI00046CA812|nr:EAL domain-containing protein [Hippea sp. KM1]
MKRIEFDEATLKAISNTTIFGVYVYQKDGRFVFVNDAFCRLVGYQKEELLSGQVKLLDLIKDEYKERAKSIIERRVAGEFFSREFSEITYLTKDRQTKLVLNFGYTVIYDSKPSGFVITVDITKQKTYEILYKALAKVNELSTNITQEDEILKQTVRVLNEDVGFDLVCLGYVDEKTELFKEKYIAGKQTYIDIFRNIKISVNPDIPEGRGSIGRSYREKRIVTINNIYSDKGMSAWRSVQKRFGVYSVCSIPLFKNGDIAYILILYSKIPNIFSGEFMHLINSLSKTLNSTLEKLETQKWKTILEEAVNLGFEFILIAEEDLKIVYANDNATQTLGYTKHQLLNKRLNEIVYQENDRDIGEVIEKQDYSGNCLVFKLKTDEGNIKKALFHLSKVKTDRTYIIAAGKDITENTELQRLIENALRRDSITNLLNRYAFTEAIERYIERAQYQDRLGAVVVLKPINFSLINEVVGFQKGNLILKEIGERIKKHLRRYDIIAKLESSKFAILLKDMKREEDILVISMDLIRQLSKPYDIDGQRFNLSFNVGISIYPIDSKDPIGLLDKAEIALIDARLKGENSIGFYKEELKSETERKLKINQEFPEALKNKEFVLYFQPYFSIATGAIEGAEVLIRWIKNGTVISPLEFIPIFEQTRNIVKLENYIIDEVVELLSTNSIDKPLSVNISATSLMDEAFTEKLIGLQPQYKKLINIEITERLFLDKPGRASSILHKLRNEGYRVYIDDFGTGYSSLSYISNLPIDCIKIDISFVRQMMENPKTKAIVKTIVYLAQQLNLTTIAEGVESKEQLETLKEMGCQIAQGFLFSKPLPKEEFLNLLEKYQ